MKFSIIRLLLGAVALYCLSFVLPATLRADDFSFTFTDTAGQTGNVDGLTGFTVTGEILGLTDNTTSAAVDVILTGGTWVANLADTGFLATACPSGGVQPACYDLGTWTVESNSFTETNGVITSWDFEAPFAGELAIYQFTLEPGLSQLTIVPPHQPDEIGVIGGSATFTPLVSTPEPSTLTMMLIGLVSLVGMGARFERIARKA